MFVPYNSEEIRLAYKSKHNCKREYQVILLIIAGGKKCHYFPVKSLFAFFRGMTSKHVGDFYYLNCFHYIAQKKKLKKHEKVCNNHDYCNVEMPNEDNKIIKYSHGESH